jgi:peroxiredoxin Q/BCP
MALLNLGSMPPALRVELQDGRRVLFSDFTGKYLVVYFYPMDDTPGCRTEARNFRDVKSDLDALEAVVLGVSRQDAGSHCKFVNKEQLNFDLVVDRDGRVAKAFGVGTLGPFTARRTFLFNKQGKLVKVWPRVVPAHHAEDVVNSIRALETAPNAHGS